MSTVQPAVLTLAEFERLPEPPDGSRLELVRGKVVSMPPPKGKHGVVCAQLAWLLSNFVRPRRLGWVTTNDTGVVLGRDPDTLRGPDVAFWSLTRQPLLPDGYFLIPPDLAAEVLSPDDRRADVRAKIRDYVAAGVPLVWLVDPEARTVTVYRGSMRGTEYDEADTLEGGEVLPGLTLPITDLFAV